MDAIVIALWIGAAYLATGICVGLFLLREARWISPVALLISAVAWPAILITAATTKEADQ